MFVEILITSVIVIAALHMLYKSIKRSSQGKCSGCAYKSSGCSHCTLDSKK